MAVLVSWSRCSPRVTVLRSEEHISVDTCGAVRTMETQESEFWALAKAPQKLQAPLTVVLHSQLSSTSFPISLFLLFTVHGPHHPRSFLKFWLLLDPSEALLLLTTSCSRPLATCSFKLKFSQWFFVSHNPKIKTLGCILGSACSWGPGWAVDWWPCGQVVLQEINQGSRVLWTIPEVVNRRELSHPTSLC